MKRWPIIVAAALSILLIGGYFLVQTKVKNLIQEKASASGILQYNKLELSLWKGDISLEDARINYKLIAQDKYLEASSPKLSIEGISWWQLIKTKKLFINDLYLFSPIINIKNFAPKDDQPTIPDSTTSEALTALELQHIHISDGSFLFFKNKKDSIASIKLDTFNLEFAEIKVSKNTPAIKDAIGTFKGLSFRTEKNLQRILIQQISFSKKDSLFEITGLKAVPQFDKTAFFQQIKYKKARLDLDFPNVKMEGWDFEKMLDKMLVARKMEVSDMSLQIMVNQNMQPDPNGYKFLVQEALAKAPFPITVDSIMIEEGRLLLEIVGPGKTKSGSLRFDPVEGYVTNVTNDSTRIAELKLMELEAIGWIDGKHQVSNHFWFDLASPSHVFTFTGNLSEMPFSGLNSFLRPCANVRFDGGRINRLDFEVNADKYRAHGNLNIQYDNLDFAILDNDREEKKIFSKLVNLLFIKEDSMEGSEDFRESNIYVKRDTTRSFFNYWWEAIQSGIKASFLKNLPFQKKENKKNRAVRQ
ncbi:MAG: hypothetical protein R2788_17110 [Saprospiraceae bacterium]